MPLVRKQRRLQLCISAFLQTQAVLSYSQDLASWAYLALFLLESIVLKLLKWGTFWRSLLASLLMNLPSTLAGFGLIWLFGLSSLNRLGIWLILSTWTLSVAIEGVVLILMNRDGGRENWTASLVANTASYLLIFIIPQLL